MNEKPLTIKEVAEFLSISPSQVRYYINHGQLKAFKLGNGTGKRRMGLHWRVWKQDLLVYLDRSSNSKEEK